MILIQCTYSKRKESAKAKNLYDESSYFRKMRTYAQRYGMIHDEEWRILSAKHGLVHPETELEPYDQKGLSEQQAEEIARELVEANVKSVRIIAGQDYTNPLTPELERRGIDVVELCRGMRIGDRESRLKTLNQELKNENLSRCC